MKWKDLVCLAALLAIFLAAGRAEAMDVTLDGETISRSAELVENTTYIPLRELLGSGWEITWEQNTRTATAKGKDFTLSIPVGEPHILLDDAPYEVPPSYLKDGTTYVPLRPLAQLCALSIAWQGVEQPVALFRSSRPHTEDELYWLSRIISAESRGESLLGQLAVGTVVLNRVKNDAFPDTIYGVIFDRKNGTQFEPVENGTVYFEPTESSIMAAQLCLDGTAVAGESLYFYAPALSQGIWITENRPYLTTIGCHRFYL